MRPPTAPSRDTPLGLSISTLSLRNSLRVVIVSDPRAAEVQVTMRYQVGAVDDPPMHGGMAHLVEHLMFEQPFAGQTITRRLAAIATYFNAMTMHDATTYVARAHPSKLSELLAVEAFRLRTKCGGISNAIFERERDVVLNELRYREEALQVQTMLGRALFATDHPYSRPIAGTVESVAAITREQACAFADSHYAVGRAVLVVSGNLTRAQVEDAMAELGRVPSGTHSTPAGIPLSPLTTQAVEVEVPIEGHGLVLVWPLPSDTKQHAKYRALLTAAAELVSADIDGSAALIEPGGTRAGMIGLLLSAGDDETDIQLINAASRGLERLPKLFERQGVREIDQLGFSRTRHEALYRLFATLDDAGARDPMLATYVAEGFDPNIVVRGRVDGLRELTRDEAIEISREHLKYNTAKVITLKPVKKQLGQRLKLSSSLAVLDEHRAATAEPKDAHQPATATPTSKIQGIKTRKLANGLDVILLPVGTAPIIDMRLVFRAGTGDEPAAKRGIALLAAHGLTFDERHVKDLLAFATAGGNPIADVELDRTTFTVRGMSGQLDFLLAGLRRIVREGTYHDGIVSFMHGVKRAHREDNARADAWREALFGADHPYAKAGLFRHADERLTEDDAEQFRANHFTPDNATLIVAGHFDPVIVDRWIDYLFADWTGRAASRAAPPISFTPAAFATIEDEAHVEMDIVFPATAREHAVRLVAAQMLSELASNVRTQLGASYDASAELQERRLAATYVVTMEVDATRATAAAKHLAERIAKLHADPEFAARTFVAARQRVLAQLAAIGDSATRLANRVERDVELGRDVTMAGVTAEDVRKLTIGQMTAALADLALSRAVISMRGPAEIKQAFDALGREPRHIAAPAPRDDEEEDTFEAGAESRLVDNSAPPELVDPLTSPSSPFRMVSMFAAGASFATMERVVESVPKTTSYSGPSLSAAIGYRRRSSIRAGLQLGLARLAGTTTGLQQQDVSFLSVDLGPFFQARLHGPFWFGGVAGVRFEHDTKLHTGGQVGVQLGLDLVPIKYGWLSLLARYDYLRMPDASYGELTVGAALRR